MLVEKPMVTTVKHALEIRKKVRETGKILAIGYKTPAMASFKHLRKIISDRRFGRLQLINGYLCQDWLNNTRGMWRQDPLVSGGGQAYDSGAHILNSLTWSVKSIPTEVYAMIDTCGLEVDVNSVIAVRFENGVLANIAIGGNTASKGGSGGTHMVYLFERGRVEIDGWRGSWIEVFDEKGPVELDADSLRSELPTNNFVAAILGLEEPATDVEDGVLQSLLMESLYRSAQTGTVIRPKVRHLP